MRAHARTHARTHMRDALLRSDIKTGMDLTRFFRLKTSMSASMSLFIVSPFILPVHDASIRGYIVNRLIKAVHHIRANTKAEGSFTVYSRSHSNACLSRNRSSATFRL